MYQLSAKYYSSELAVHADSLRNRLQDRERSDYEVTMALSPSMTLLITPIIESPNTSKILPSYLDYF